MTKLGQNSYKVGIIGASGFAGIELVRLIATHPRFLLYAATSDEFESKRIDEVYPSLTGITDLSFLSHDTERIDKCDVVFLCTPHTASMKVVPDLLKGGKLVVDLSADYRLNDAASYEKWYGVKHASPELLQVKCFGLPELFIDDIERARNEIEESGRALIACAGCYPTATSLAAFPAISEKLISADAPVFVDAISGVTGAGKKCSDRTHFCFANENVEAYGVANHRHTPEIEQILGISGRLVFTPHLAPLSRGLLSTVKLVLRPSAPKDASYYLNLYEDFYKISQNVLVLKDSKMPKTSSVARTNKAQIGIAYNASAHVLVVSCAIDNITKGAAGQALQCANLALSLPENAGLEDITCGL